MSTEKQNIFIEKFKGDFKKEKDGCTIFPNQSLQSIRNPVLLAIYVYLASKPQEWQINIKQLMNHFNIGKNKAYQAISDLTDMGLIKRTETRDKGKFLNYEYYLFLKPKPITENREMVSPIPEKPVPGSPIPGNRETYKEKSFCIKRKEDKKRDFLSTQKPRQADLNNYKWHKEREDKFEMPDNLKYIAEWLEQNKSQI